jgi:hypothetical protein
LYLLKYSLAATMEAMKLKDDTLRQGGSGAAAAAASPTASSLIPAPGPL